MARDTGKLDIRFVSLDSANPYLLTESFSPENRELVTNELHERLGHLLDKINGCGGHIRVFTQANSVVGVPQYIDFSQEVWEKLLQPHQKMAAPSELQSTNAAEDYLDHENYTDL